ncbi:MAG: hypothetical protein ACHRHE_10520 [Tepidisphaerales bacterium]
MIDFKCHCGYQFSVPQELSGSSLQCPGCHLLADVPLLSDLESINPDGTVKVEALALKSEPERIKELQRIYRPSRRDNDGNELDLRATFEEIQKAGVEEIPIGSKDGLIPGAPKYDPETGELIVPLDIKREAQGPRPAIPVAPKSLNYAQGPTTALPGFVQTIAGFMSAGSVAVLFSILMVHLLVVATWVPVGFGMIFAGVFVLFFYGMIFAHYAIVVEDMGPGEHDELPVPLRGLSFSEDIWHPSVNVYGSLIMSYSLVLLSMPMKNVPVTLGMAVVGTVLFPAVFLICCTSGMLSDLRPDRLLGTLAACGWRYYVAVVLWVISAAVYGKGILGTARLGLALGPIGRERVGPHYPIVDLPAMCVGIVLMHIFALYLGHLYRRFHADFPWAIRHTHLPAERARSRRRRYGQLLSGKVLPTPKPDAPPPAAQPAAAPSPGGARGD